MRSRICQICSLLSTLAGLMKAKRNSHEHPLVQVPVPTTPIQARRIITTLQLARLIQLHQTHHTTITNITQDQVDHIRRRRNSQSIQRNSFNQDSERSFYLLLIAIK